MGSPYVILALCVLAAVIVVYIVWRVSRYALRTVQNRHVLDSGKPLLLPLVLLLGPVAFLGFVMWRLHRRG